MKLDQVYARRWDSIVYSDSDGIVAGGDGLLDDYLAGMDDD
jgi:hypothetical protein